MKLHRPYRAAPPHPNSPSSAVISSPRTPAFVALVAIVFMIVLSGEALAVTPRDEAPRTASSALQATGEDSESPEPSAALDGPGPLRLAAVIAAALDANRGIEAARLRQQAATHVPARVTDLPDPTLLAGIYSLPLNTFNPLDAQLRIQATQAFPHPGTRDARGRVAELEIERLGHVVEDTKTGVAVDAQRAYYDLYFWERAKREHERHLELVRDLANVAETRYATGLVPQENVLRSLVEISDLYAQLADVDGRIADATARLNSLLHRDPRAPLGHPEAPAIVAPAVDLEELYALAVSRHPMLAALDAAVVREEATIERERAEAKTDYSVSAALWHLPDGMGDAAVRFTVFGTFTLPWIHDAKYAAAIAEAHDRRRAASVEREAAWDRIRGAIAASVESLRATARIVEIYRTSLLPQSEQSLLAARSAYEGGVSTFVPVIDNEQTLLMNRLTLTRFEADYGHKLADLSAALGWTDTDALFTRLGSGPGEPERDER